MDKWIANLADGSCIEEEWLNGYLSPWQRLMQYCKSNNTYIESLRFTIGNVTKACPRQALGYWHSKGRISLQNESLDPELATFSGIGWVDKDLLVNIIWGSYDFITHNPIFNMEQRSSANQQQIIWSYNIGA